MSAIDLAAALVIASVVAVCVGAVVFSAREAGRGAGRSLTTRPDRSAGPPIARRGLVAAPPHRRSADHPSPEALRRRKRATGPPRRRD